MSQNERLSDIEQSQARLRETIEESKRMIGRSQAVLNRNRSTFGKEESAR